MAVGKRPWKDDEVRQLIEGARVYFPFPTNYREPAMYSIMATTGLRIGEVLQLKFRDVADSHWNVVSAMDIKRSYVKTKRVGRFIPVVDACRSWIEEYLAAIKPWMSMHSQHSLWVKRVHNGGKVDLVQGAPHDKNSRKTLKALCQFLGIDDIDTSFHSFRKYAANRFYKASEHDLIATKTFLGHSNIRSTMHYLENCDERVDELIKAMFEKGL